MPTAQLDTAARRAAVRWPNIPVTPMSRSSSVANSRGNLNARAAGEPSFSLGSFSPEDKNTKEAPLEQRVVGPVIFDLTENEPDGMTTPALEIPRTPAARSPYTENVIYSECALAARWDISPKCMNLNAVALAAEYSDSPIIKRTVKPGKFARSPWAMGVNHPPRDEELTHSLYDWISSTASRELERD